VVIKGFRPIHDAGALVASIDVELPSGLRLTNLQLFQSHGKKWIGMSLPVVDRDGVQRRDERGRRCFVQGLAFRDQATADSFRRQLFAAIDRHNTGSESAPRRQRPARVTRAAPAAPAEDDGLHDDIGVVRELWQGEAP
jgi:hypothetical protein